MANCLALNGSTESSRTDLLPVFDLEVLWKPTMRNYLVAQHSRCRYHSDTRERIKTESSRMSGTVDFFSLSLEFSGNLHWQIILQSNAHYHGNTRVRIRTESSGMSKTLLLSVFDVSSFALMRYCLIILLVGFFYYAMHWSECLQT